MARSRPRKSAPSGSLSPAARHAIQTRKREAEKLKRDCQEILISEPGTYLGRSGQRIVIRREGKRVAEVPLSLVRNVTLLTSAFSISGELMAEAASRRINIILNGVNGRPAVRIGSSDQPEHQMSLAQSHLATSKAGLEIARILVAGKIRNQANLLRYYLKYPDRKAGDGFLVEGSNAVKQMEHVRDAVLASKFVGDIDLDLERNRLFAAEGRGASFYWGAVRLLLDPRHGFDGRVRRGAEDLVNSLLNYGYGILYSRCLLVLLRAGLNIHVGFLHKPQPGKAGLLYDFVEEFRTAAVDRVVFAILNLSVPVERTNEGLTQGTRRDLAHRVLDRLRSPLRYHGENVPLQEIIEQQARLLMLQIEGSAPYKTFVLPW